MDLVGDFTVPKRRIAADVLLWGTAPRPAELFVAEHEEQSYRRAGLGELLEHARPFLPAWDPAEGCAVFINKSQLVWLATAPEPDEDDDGLVRFEQRQPACVELVGGGMLEGDVLYSAPAERARLSDHLNEASRYLRLRTAERLMFVGKSFVLRAFEARVRGGEAR